MNPDQILGFLVGAVFVLGWLLLTAWLANSVENRNHRD